MRSSFRGDSPYRSWVRRTSCRADCPPRVVLLLAGDTDAVARRAAAEHRNCPPAQVQALAADPDPTVRRAVSTRGDCTPEVLALLAGEENHWIRANVAWRSKCPELLARLAGDEHSRVRQVAQERLTVINRPAEPQPVSSVAAELGPGGPFHR